MKSVYRLSKVTMSLTPEVLLSSASRERCINNISELPQFVKIGKTKYNASVLVPLCVDNGEVCLLYTLRSSNLSSHSGQVSFPGGKMDENESVYDAALRETEEEIGIPAKDIAIWAAMCRVQGRDPSISVTPVVGEIINFDMKKLKPNPDEVAEIFTVPMRSLCNSNNHGCYKYNGLPIPVFTTDKHTLWGLTGMITHLFLQTFLPSDVYIGCFLRKEYNLSELMPSKL